MPRNEDIEKLRDLMKDIKFCMLATHDSAGHIRSRPMAMQHSEFNGDLWFFTGKSTGKTDEIKDDQQVNVSFSIPGSNKYVSVSGPATLLQDRAKAAELWNPAMKVWFPEGVDDPNLALLRVTVESAEYWDAPHGTITYLLGFLKVAATGERPKNLGDHAKIELAR